MKQLIVILYLLLSPSENSGDPSACTSEIREGAVIFTFFLLYNVTINLDLYVILVSEILRAAGVYKERIKDIELQM